MKEILLLLIEALLHQKKKFRINFSKSNTKLYLSLNYNTGNSYLFVKTDNKNFPTQFSLGSIFNEFSAIEFREVLLNENVCDFLVDHESIDKSDILKLRKYIMTKNNIK